MNKNKKKKRRVIDKTLGSDHNTIIGMGKQKPQKQKGLRTKKENQMSSQKKEEKKVATKNNSKKGEEKATKKAEKKEAKKITNHTYEVTLPNGEKVTKKFAQAPSACCVSKHKGNKYGITRWSTSLALAEAVQREDTRRIESNPELWANHPLGLPTEILVVTDIRDLGLIEPAKKEPKVKAEKVVKASKIMAKASKRPKKLALSA
jgi:hypothetical protein